MAHGDQIIDISSKLLPTNEIGSLLLFVAIVDETGNGTKGSKPSNDITYEDLNDCYEKIIGRRSAQSRMIRFFRYQKGDVGRQEGSFGIDSAIEPVRKSENQKKEALATVDFVEGRYLRIK